MSARLTPRVPCACAAAAIAALASATPTAQQDATARARAIHERVIALDTHNDIDPQNFTASCNYTMRLTTQVNLPKMKEGGLDASFFIVYVGQQDPRNVPDALSAAGYERAYRAAIAKFDAVHRLTEQIAPEAEMIYLDYTLILGASRLGADIVDAFHRHARLIDAWTLNADHPDAAASLRELVGLRVDQITTDEPIRLEELFAEIGRLT